MEVPVDFLKNTGDNVSLYIGKGISYMSTATPSKIVGIIISLLIGLMVLKFINNAVKFVVIAVIVFLVASLGVSLFL